MGVYINMEIPTHCMDCPFLVSRENDDCILQSAKANEGFENWEQMKDGCPLVLVPPHGKLIDADKFVSERLEFEARHYVVRDEFDKGRVAGWNDVSRALREYAPTIIPASGGEDNG